MSAQCAAAGKRFRRPNSKIRSDLILEFVQPMADVCARQPLSKSHPTLRSSSGRAHPTQRNQDELYHFPPKPVKSVKRQPRKLLSLNTEKTEAGRHGVLMKGTRLFLCARFAPSLRLNLEKRSPAQIPLKRHSFAPKLRSFSRKARLRLWHKGGSENSS